MAEALRRLLVDARPIDHPTARERGIGRYVTGLLRGLDEVGAPAVALVGSPAEAELVREAVSGLPIETMSRATVRRHATEGTWFLATQLMLHPLALDPIPSCVTEARLPVGGVMYDVIPYRHPEIYLDRLSPRRQAPLRAALARTLDAVLAISRFAADTSRDELRLDPARVHVIGAGVDDQFQPSSDDPRRHLSRILPDTVGRFVVSVTGGDERKNTRGLLAAWGRLPATIRERYHLVVAAASAPPVLARWQAWAREFGCSDEVTFTGAVTDVEMVALLQAADLAVVPSVEEGFGLPVVEAAACGTPVICSGVSSLPEVLDEPAACFDPHDPSSIASSIEAALTSEELRRVLLQAGAGAAQRWRWPAVARAAIAALDATTPRDPRPPRAPRQTIAVAGPFDGSPSGVGAYDEAVANALDKVTSSELVRLVDVSCTALSSDPGPARFPAGAAGSLVKMHEFDDVVAVLGSSQYHVASERIARLHPCHVWLHEASLAGLHVGLAHLSGSERWAARYLADRLAAGGHDLGAHELASPATLLDVEQYAGWGATLLSEPLRLARSVIVHSEIALERVRAAVDPVPPALVVPLAFPAPTEPSQSGRGQRERARDIVVAGWLAGNKSPEVALHALAELSDLPDVRIVFVGAALGDAAEAVRVECRRLGLTDRVEITGRVTDEEYSRRLAAARVGLQLRRNSNGEMSAAIADLMAHGVPVVTNMSSAGEPSPGLRVLPANADPTQIAAAIRPLLDDDDRWRDAHADARGRSAAWTFDHLATVLLEWLRDADGLPAGTVRRAGPQAG